MNNITSHVHRIPVIQTGHALQSLRDSGHSLPTALGEVLDNSIEANANYIRVQLDEDLDKKGKRHVHRIAIADDGIGMSNDILHHYLVLGFSTRYMRKDTIGKYGVGAKLAALNLGRRIDVWSRNDPKSEWMHVYFDLDEAIQDELEGRSAGLDAPESTVVPEELQNLLPKDTGTLVVWSRVDRLEEGRLENNFDELRRELEKELARMFRNFISGGIRIQVNETELMAHDPLYLMEGTWADDYLAKMAKANDKRDGKKTASPSHYQATVIGDHEIDVGEGKARLIVTLYPKEAIRPKGKGGDAIASKLRIPDNLGAISFVRLNREVQYTNVPKIFPRGVTDPDRYIGIEVSFNPDLDDYFGIRNVKRGVEPHGELREKIRTLLARDIASARRMLDEIWSQITRDSHVSDGEHAAILDAVKDIDVTMPKGRVEVQNSPAEVGEAFKELAVDVVGEEDVVAQENYLEKVKDLPYIIESVNFPGNMFMSTQHLAGKVVIRLNTRHPFYREMWEPIREIAERDPGAVSGEEAVKTARRTVEALTLLLIAYGKAESMHANPGAQYDDLLQFWGQFLSTLLKKVKNVI